jgi:two-component system response regulator NreC
MSEPISVLIADDHAVVRAGLRLLLTSQRDIRVAGECGTHGEVLAFLHKAPRAVDIVTLDLTMPGGSPAVLIEDIIRHYPHTRVVVLTMHDDPSYARMAMTTGASGFVVKSAADTEILDAIRTVARGGTHGGIATAAAGRQPHTTVSPGHPAIDALSQREREVLVLIARGHSNQQIADKLFLSVKTVESYRSRLMTKLGLKDRSELTRLALETGLLATEPS